MLWDIGRQQPGQQRRQPVPVAESYPEDWSAEEAQAQRILTCLRQCDSRTAQQIDNEESITEKQEVPRNNTISCMFDCFQPLQKT